MNYSKIKIKEKAGLVRAGTNNAGEVEWIGTAQNWQTATDIEDMLDTHDCHLPDSCQCEDYLPNLEDI